ncbi:MAG: SLATT domain-containing protein [Gaiellaceae bacterium]
MSSRAAQVLAVYRAARVEDQIGFYKKRRGQFERAHGQLLIASAVLLGVTSTVSALAGASIEGKLVWAALATILPAISTALVAYGALFAFDRHAKLYADAVRNLGLLEEPDLSHATDADEAVRTYVEEVEKVLRDEQSQWGQLASEAQPNDAKTG